MPRRAEGVARHIRSVLHPWPRSPPTRRATQFVSSNAWLGTQYGVALQQFLLRETRIVAIVGSEAEPFFPQAAINTVVTIVERPKPPLTTTDDYDIRFVTLKQTIAAITASLGHGDRWAALDAIAGSVESAYQPFEDGTLRLRLGSRLIEYAKLQEHLHNLPWHLPLRAPRLLLEALHTDYRHA